ncbi:MAG: 2-C-methyl-D-erythritol 4-phosphate cytidylyltransferase [Deltaproteobacteria bacterium]|nr:2-C-methyl-D-erythritol 4-phosphate cytidylyltransferase [Deltaproteobacteria bacterium]
MKASAIIVAAGSGTRLGLAMPKAFVSIGGESLLFRALQTVGAVKILGEVVVAVPPGTQKSARAEADAARVQIPVKITEGGAQRQDSVRLALMLTSAEADLIVVHDAARPFATPAMFSACIAAAAQSGGAVVAIAAADTLKKVENGTILATVPREGLWQAQTPQAFRRDLLVRAHEWAMRERITVTDDAYLFECLGLTVQVVQGAAVNLKITTPDDLRIGEAIARFVSPR